MALSVSQANTIDHEVFGKKYLENVYDKRPFLKKLQMDKQVKIRGGTQLTWPVQYKEYGTAGSSDFNDQVNFQSVDTWTQAVLDWAHVDANAMITKEEKLKNASGPNQIVDIIKAKAKALENDLAEELADQVFATSSVSNHIIPLYTIVDSADTYAGIAVADATIWAGIEDSSSTALTRALLYTSCASATFGDGEPTMHFTTRALVAYFNALLGQDERYTNTREANAGFKNMTLLGNPVTDDPHLASGDWFGIDMKAFELWVMEGTGKPTDWEDAMMLGYPGALVKYVDWAGNLVSYRRRTSFKLTALTGT